MAPPLLLLVQSVLALSCLAQSKVVVHVVPHTHDDVGWLKTVDEYYTGQNASISKGYVRMILDTVIENLQKNPKRTFTYVELAFFQRWWRQLDAITRNITQQLVRNGQLSFSNGGWCMHDEATPFYLDMIDQTMLGHKFLMEEFGFAPKTGWQLDPFGHSATQAALLSAEVGFTGLFFGRIDYQDLAVRTDSKTKAAEFIWRASPSLGSAAQVFSGLTGEYGGNYGPPEGFNFEGDAETIQDDPALTNYNVKSRVDDFVAAALWQANRTRGKNIMFTMGSDFQWENARLWYENLDRIIKYVNADGRVTAIYSTPEMYLDAKAKEASVSWPLKTDDFFPYADAAHQVWTGFFTSRPALKRYARETSSYFQVVKQLESLALGVASPEQEKLAEALGVAQHHDAVTGTEKQHVAFDYAMRLASGRAGSLRGVSKALAALTGAPVSFEGCDLLNVSVCRPTQMARDVGFVLWNGLAQARAELIELPVGSEHVSVFDGSGKPVQGQLVPSLPSLDNYGHDAGGGKQALLFHAVVPPLGFASYMLKGAKGRALGSLDSHPASITLKNEFLALEFCEGSLCKITNVESNTVIRAHQSWLWYQGSDGNAESSQASGAYIFRPNKSTATPVFSGKPTTRLVRGPLADEVHQTFGPWVSQRIRLEHGAKHAEITYTVGPIPVGDRIGKEVVSRITTDIANDGECFTDSNGREMLLRKRDYRPSWKLNQTEPVAGNFYPVATSIFIRDTRAQLTVLTDATQAGTGCIHNGELELMVHRALLHDDSKGVGEPLNETEFMSAYVGKQEGRHSGPGLIIRGRHILTLEAPSAAAKVWRPLQDQLYMPLRPFFTEDGTNIALPPSFSALANPLPVNVQLVTLQQWERDTVLLRLAHQFGLEEDEALSEPATVDLASLFTGRHITEVDERGLAVTISRAEVLRRRVQWQVDGEEAAPSPANRTAAGSTVVTLGPLQIRTFLVKFARAGVEQLIV